jgi:hypothetical protein
MDEDLLTIEERMAAIAKEHFRKARARDADTDAQIMAERVARNLATQMHVRMMAALAQEIREERIGGLNQFIRMGEPVRSLSGSVTVTTNQLQRLQEAMNRISLMNEIGS